jgi:hypothetical protein
MTPQERALIMVYESVKHRFTKGFEVFAEALKDWDVIPLTECGKIIGGVLVKGNELHVGCAQRPRSSPIKYVRLLKSIIDKYGYAVTSVQADNSIGLRFCLRLGFVKLSEANGMIQLRCDRSNF